VKTGIQAWRSVDSRVRGNDISPEVKYTRDARPDVNFLPKGTFGSTIIMPASAKQRFEEDYVNSVTVILPTYNERENIGPLIERTLAAINGWAIEVLVVDDDSPDETWKVVEEMAGRDAASFSAGGRRSEASPAPSGTASSTPEEMSSSGWIAISPCLRNSFPTCWLNSHHRR